MKLQDIMPVAGVDHGTLRGRFRHSRVPRPCPGENGNQFLQGWGVSARWRVWP